MSYANDSGAKSGAQEACCRSYARFGDRHDFGCQSVEDALFKATAAGLANPACRSDPWAHRSVGRRCGTCVFYVTKVDVSDKPLRELGRCRRHAPTLSGYPVVSPSDWCGDHKLKG